MDEKHVLHNGKKRDKKKIIIPLDVEDEIAPYTHTHTMHKLNEFGSIKAGSNKQTMDSNSYKKFRLLAYYQMMIMK
mgnify:CR=1 FL=1